MSHVVVADVVLEDGVGTEPLFTMWTLILLLARMQRDMGLQVSFLRESLSTKGA